VAGKQKLRWAGAIVASVLSISVANAQFSDPKSMSGFITQWATDPHFIDFDNDGDLDIVLGYGNGNIQYVENEEGIYSSPGDVFSSASVDSLASPAISDVDGDDDLDLVIGELYGELKFYENEGGVFTEVTGMGNPFDGIDVGFSSKPCFVDLDEDGDEDLVVGSVDGELYYWENNGGVFTELLLEANPFDGIVNGISTVPNFVDYDDDGDLDLYMGDKYGTLNYYRNDEGTFVQQTGEDNPFNSVSIDSLSAPFVADFDDDNDLDLAVGDLDSQILRYFRNDGGVLVEKRGTPNPFEGVLSYFSFSPAFFDYDDDGDLDLVIGEMYGPLKYYENNHEGFELMLGEDNPFNDIVISALPKPVFGDIDNDGDSDLLIGNAYGTINYYVNDGGDFFEITGVSNPFDAVAVPELSAPALVDFNNNGSLDLFVGSYDGSGPAEDVGLLAYYRNVSGSYFEMTGSDNPFEELFETDTVYGAINPVFADVDMDGDMDLFVGDKYGGTIELSENADGTYSRITESDNPFDEMLFGLGVSPAFADLDNDGDLDLYVGILDKYNGGRLLFVENNADPVSVVDPVTVSNGSIEIYAFDNTIALDPQEAILNKVEVFTVSGSLLIHETPNTFGKHEINMSAAQPGIYIVRAYSNGSVTNAKVVIR
jgi:hypothetical protein